jgi:predicted Fe-Mo cluster-binding NifX family protein
MVLMRIAVATADGTTVAPHITKSLKFVVYEVDDTAIGQRTERLRSGDGCGVHKTFTELLEGCAAVLCGGVGQGAVDALAAAGTETIVLARPYGVEEAIAGYAAGTLEKTNARVCLCGPGR